MWLQTGKPFGQQIENGRAHIDRGRCIHCFCCQEFCPRGAMQVHRTVIARIAGHL